MIKWLLSISQLDNLHLLVQEHSLFGPHDNFRRLVHCLQPDFIGAAFVDEPVIISVILRAGAFKEGFILQTVGFRQLGLSGWTLLVLAR